MVVVLPLRVVCGAVLKCCLVVWIVQNHVHQTGLIFEPLSLRIRYLLMLCSIFPKRFDASWMIIYWSRQFCTLRIATHSIIVLNMKKARVSEQSP